MSPKGKHSALQLGTVELLNAFAVPLKLARAFPELHFSFAGPSRVPDVSLYRLEHIPRDPNGEIGDEFN